MTVFKTPILPSGGTEVQVYYDCSVGVSLPYFEVWGPQWQSYFTSPGFHRPHITWIHVTGCLQIWQNEIPWLFQTL